MAHLLFLSGTPPDVLGGSGTYVGVSVLREALLRMGHRVDLVTTSSPRGPLAMAARLGFNLRTRRAAELLRPDVLVGFDLDGVFCRTGRPVHVAAIKGVVAEELKYERGWKRGALRLEAVLEGWHVRRADAVVTTSAYAARCVAADYGLERERVRVVPELIDLRRWRGALEADPRKPATPLRILCVAHLYPRKDVATLMRAMGLLRNDAALRVVGVGPELVALERLASRLDLGKRVAFLGHLPYRVLAGEYRNADIFCLPSRQEGFGIVFLEAMAAGLPIVATRAAAIPEVVLDGECGALVEPGDVSGLSTTLDRLLENPAERRRLGEAGKRRVERYDAAGVAAQFLEAIGISAFPSEPHTQGEAVSSGGP